jgi:hypothetical protein
MPMTISVTCDKCGAQIATTVSQANTVLQLTAQTLKNFLCTGCQNGLQSIYEAYVAPSAP